MGIPICWQDKGREDGDRGAYCAHRGNSSGQGMRAFHGSWRTSAAHGVTYFINAFHCSQSRFWSSATLVGQPYLLGPLAAFGSPKHSSIAPIVIS